jgi:hypothetical protein
LTTSPACRRCSCCSLSRHCPYVKHVQSQLGRLAAEYAERGVAVVGICSNDVARYPDDAPDGLARQIEEAGFTFPYLVDESQEVAHAYGAACTPDFFVFDGDRRLVYRGQMDGSRPGSGVPVTGEDLRAAAPPSGSSSVGWTTSSTSSWRVRSTSPLRTSGGPCQGVPMYPSATLVRL